VILCNEESSARSRTIRAALHCMLDREPIVNTVSWMVPIGRVLAEGGIPAAYACYHEIQENPEYFFEEEELIVLVRQLCNVRKYDLAIDVLELNLHVFPRHLDSLTYLAKLCTQTGDRARAEAAIQKVLAIDPGNSIADLLHSSASK
jgi:tetratricopeptide (TPR) repeat protein